MITLFKNALSKLHVTALRNASRFKRAFLNRYSAVSANSLEKSEMELAFWDSWCREHGVAPETEYYRKFMMDMGGVTDESFFDGLVCVDIGCGPKGSLTWLKGAKAAIGVDPLAESYMRLGIADHNMIYLNCGSEHIPLPTAYVDVVFSMNSLDHVDNLPVVCKEIRRILKPGGYFIGSLNMNEPKTATEPWTLTEQLLEKLLFSGWEKEFYMVRPRIADTSHFGPYKYFYEDPPPELIHKAGPGALWCRFRVR